MSEILAQVTRGQILESVHRGNFVVIEGDGTLVAQSLKVPDGTKVHDSAKVHDGTKVHDRTFWRSSSKAFQALPMIMSGAADFYGFGEREIALSCASHAGETMHTQLAAQMLARLGLGESDLRCGAHRSIDRPSADAMIRAGAEPTQLNHNCSGKHAAMLTFANYIGADLKHYLDLNNPIQQTILKTVARFTGVPAAQIPIGIDGCSAPNFALSLRAMALAYARLINARAYFGDEKLDDYPVGIADACERIVRATMKFPELVAGTGQFDTQIMRALPGRIMSKGGAEGVWCAGVLPNEKWPRGLAIALKIDDGSQRARPVIALELLRQLQVMTPDAEAALGQMSPEILLNSGGVAVGEIKANFAI